MKNQEFKVGSCYMIKDLCIRIIDVGTDFCDYDVLYGIDTPCHNFSCISPFAIKLTEITEEEAFVRCI